MATQFVPTAIDWRRHPKRNALKRILGREALDRWLLLVELCTQTRTDGLLIVSDGTPLRIEDIAEIDDGDVERWSEVFKVLVELEMVVEHEDGPFQLLIWDIFHYDKDERGTSATEKYEKYKKRSQRAEAKIEEQAAELAEALAALAEQAEEIERLKHAVQATKQINDSHPLLSVSPGVPDLSQVSPNVPDVPAINEFTLNVPESKLTNSKDKRLSTSARELSSKNPSRETATEAQSFSINNSTFSSDQLVEELSQDYRELMSTDGKPKRFGSRSRMDFLTWLTTEPWSELDPHLVLVAIRLACHEAASLIATDETVKSDPWAAALDRAVNMLPEAELYLSSVSHQARGDPSQLRPTKDPPRPCGVA